MNKIMRKNTSRILAILLALLMCFAMMSVVGYADEENDADSTQGNTSQTDNPSADKGGNEETDNTETEAEAPNSEEETVPEGTSSDSQSSAEDDSEEEGDEDIAPTFSLNTKSVRLAMNGDQSFQLIATKLTDAAINIEWNVIADPEGCVTVDSGLLQAVENGSATVIAVDLNSGYSVEASVTVKDVTVTNGAAAEGGSSAGFVEGASSEEISDEDVPLATAGYIFEDVKAGSWAAKAIGYVADRGIFMGTSATTFDPAGNATREQVMTVLARYAGQTGATIEEGVAWAVEYGISDGTNPKGTITREEFVTMLWRMASRPEGESTLDFADANEIHEWSQGALKWAVANGIVTGYSNGKLDPLGVITRAQMATIIQRCDVMGLVMA